MARAWSKRGRKLRTLQSAYKQILTDLLILLGKQSQQDDFIYNIRNIKEEKLFLRIDSKVWAPGEGSIRAERDTEKL